MQLTEDVFKRRNESGGSIEVICGSMFSGKTEELIRRINRVRIAKFATADIQTQTVGYPVRRKGGGIPQLKPPLTQFRLQRRKPYYYKRDALRRVIGIDEAQFFDDKLPEVCNILANKGVRVIIAGLDMDFGRGRPFWPNACLAGHCRVGNQGACSMCGMR